MTNAQYRSFSGTYRVTVEFSLKYCDNSIKIESPSNVGYETDRNSAKGRQFVVTLTRKQNFFDKKKKKIAKYSLLSLLYQHTRRISNQNSFLNEYNSDSAIKNSRKRKLSNTLM